jgi:pimeloyl-ACP methyl ester carboxylesterase
MASIAASALFTDNLPPADLKASCRRSRHRCSFVYGERGQPSEKPANEGFYAAARGPKELWEVPGSGHMKGVEAQPNEYERRIVGLLRPRSVGEPQCWLNRPIHRGGCT